MIDVPVRNVKLMGVFINDHAGRSTDVFRVIASPVLSAVADLHQEFAVAGELQNLVVFCSGSRNPDIVFGIDVDSMLQLRPFISGSRTTRTTPRRDKISSRI